jgi:hypothetical protein
MIFIDAAVCCEMRRGAWLDSKSCRDNDDAGNVIEAHEHAGDFKEW